MIEIFLNAPIELQSLVLFGIIGITWFILNDIRKVRNDLVAQANPHFQSLTNIIYKWETKMATKKGEEKDE